MLYLNPCTSPPVLTMDIIAHFIGFVKRVEQRRFVLSATSRIQKSEVRSQNFKVSPMATILKIVNNAGDFGTLGEGRGIGVENSMSEANTFYLVSWAMQEGIENPHQNP